MSITFTGLASGLPVNDIITQLMSIERRPVDLLEQQKQDLSASKAYIDNVETRIKTLQTSLQKFTDGNLISSADLFKQKTTTSTDSALVSATAGANAVPQTFTVKVNQLATATKAESLGSGSPTNGQVGRALLAGDTVADLANGTGTAGSFTVFEGSNSYTVNILTTDTINDVFTKISAASGGVITGSIDGAGAITLTSSAGNIAVGANGDTSNFLAATQLSTGTFAGTTVTSANPLTGIKTSGTLVGNGARLAGGPINAGTIQIGTASFTIDATTTVDSLMAAINNNGNAGVTASYNLRTNKIELLSKTPGQTAITMNDTGGTNFFTAVNLADGGGNTLTYQSLGKNALFQINGGVQIESTSNTVGEAVTGLKDVTLNLFNTTGASSVGITINQDTDKLTTAIQDFVTNFNNAITYIDQMTDPKTGKLANDSSLIRLRNSLRTTVTDMVTNSPLYSFATIGITTGSVGATGDPSKTLVFDKTVFLNKLNSNPDDVRSLFLGQTTAPVITGVMQKLKTTIDGSLDTTNGYFYARDTAIDEQIATIDKSIARAEERLAAKEELLKRQFAAMESAISKLKAQSSYTGSQTTTASS